MRQQRAFTLIELLVVISIIALLIAILLPALTKARETTVQVECLSKIRQVSMSSHAYATDDREQRLISGTFTGAGYASTIGLDEEDWQAFVEYGFEIEMWKCPGREFTPDFNPTTGRLNHTYLYFGGVDKWRGSWGVVEAEGPVTLDDMSRGIAVITDATVQSQPPSWAPKNDYYYEYWRDTSPHGRNDDYSPRGSNHAFGDGSAEWVDASLFMPIHTWSPGARQLFWYQSELGEAEELGYITPPN